MSIMPEPQDTTTDVVKIARKPVPRRVRFEVLRRDNFTCRYCRSTENPLTIDHVTPVALGGTDEPANLVACCRDCNIGKASVAPDQATVAQVSEDALRWVKAMEMATRTAEAARVTAAERTKRWVDEWFLFARTGHAYDLPADAEQRIGQFLDAGMPMDRLCSAARIACRAKFVENRFAYFVGVANNMLAEQQAMARKLIESGAV